MTVARTALWIMLATASVTAVAWASRAGWEELDRYRRRMRAAPGAVRDASDVAFAAGVGIGTAVAVLVLGGVAMFVSL